MAAWAWYTKGRRLPTLIGKDVSGQRIPGGPYTGLQAAAVLVVPSAAWWSRGLWAVDMSGLMMLGTIVLLTVAAVKLVGKADFASRNPLLLLGGYLHEVLRPAGGLLAGRKLAAVRPHRVLDSSETAELPVAAASVQPAAGLGAVAAAGLVPSVDEPTSVAAAPSSRPDTPLSAWETAASPAGITPERPVIRPSTPAPGRRRSALEDFLSAARTGTSEKDAA